MPTLLRPILLLLAATGAFCLSACGGGGGNAGGQQVLNSTATALSLSGTPPTVTLQGRVYSFRPAATNAGGGPLTFSITNTPPWASFSPTTGRLVGTPGQVGSFDNITITASDGSGSASLGPFNIRVTAVASGSATLSWLPPTLNTDSSPLTNLQGYRIQWGTQHGDYPNSVALSNPGLTAYVVDQLTPATWFFVITAVNANGGESQFSNTASKPIL